MSSTKVNNLYICCNWNFITIRKITIDYES